MKEYALIVAGGKGLRFGSHLPKQFVELRGKPVLMHTIDAFYRYSEAVRIVLVLPEEDMTRWQSLAREHNFSRSYTLVKGGLTRFQSVKRGLQAVPDDALVAIHDGVRPLVTTEMIRESFTLAAATQSAIACVPLKDSLRMIEREAGVDKLKSYAVNRSDYRLVQTPQTFQAKLIKEAYMRDEHPDLTDDASVAERAGITLTLFEGRYDNIKITGPEDLAVAEAFIERSASM